MILEFSLTEQLVCCLVCLFIGVLFGIMYDAVRVIYMITDIDPHDKKRKSIISFIPVMIIDLLFMCVVSIIYSVIMYGFAYGKFRVIFGIISVTGFVLYNRTLSRAVIFFFRKLISLVKKVLGFIFRLLLYPIKQILKFVRVFFNLLYAMTLKKIISKVKLKLDILHFNKTVSDSIDCLIRFDDV